MAQSTLLSDSGCEPYIFVSYSHKNRNRALEIIQTLQDNGFRVWYDEGIAPASKWDDMIAKHIEQCSFFIALMSPEYVASSNCQDELDYARVLEKSRVLVYLEKTQLPSGMRMRQNRWQAIYLYECDDRKMFYERLFRSQGIDICRSDNVPLPVYRTGISTAREVTISHSGTHVNNPNALLHLIFVIDTSGSMTGTKIAEVNRGIQKASAFLLDKYGSTLSIDILQFDTLPRWRTLDDLPLTTAGLTNLGEALRALRQYGENLTKDSGCSIVFVSDGLSTDRYEEHFLCLKQETWFRLAVKTGIVIGDGAANPMLAHITGSHCAVTFVEKIDSFATMFECISVSSVMAAEQNTGRRTRIDGRDIIDWMDCEGLAEPLQWSITKKGKLTVISGAIIPDCHPPKLQPPWVSHRNTIRTIVLKEGVRVVGSFAFSNLPNLEKVVIPVSVTNIRSNAFSSCPKLKSVFFQGSVSWVRNMTQKNQAPFRKTFVWPEAFSGTLWFRNKKQN